MAENGAIALAMLRDRHFGSEKDGAKQFDMVFLDKSVYTLSTLASCHSASFKVNVTETDVTRRSLS